MSSKQYIQRIFFCIFFCTPILLASTSVYSQEDPASIRKLTVFYSSSCHKCIIVESQIMPQIEKTYKGVIEVEHLDISDIENYKLLLGLRHKHGAGFNIVLPVFYSQGNFLNGQGINKAKIQRFIAESLREPDTGEQVFPSADLDDSFRRLKPLVVMGAGLVDGINPCAFTVIVFFISFLALQGYRKRELGIIGLTFILTVFLTYILIGLGIFGFLYRIEGFWLFSRVVNLSIGIFSIILGILAVYDFFRFKKSGKTDGLLLQLPAPIKKQIHTIIGLRYRNTEARKELAVRSSIIRLISSAVITGFLVSILEAVCTGQAYLPTIVFILKTSRHWKALAYLLIYNFMFVLPLAAVLFFALLGVTSEEFSKFLKERMLFMKILMASLFFSLGIFLIWRT